MYMKATENVEMGCDVTPEIPPLSWALSDSLLSSRCSACFSKLINCFHCTAHCRGAVIYCSLQCRDTDIRTHLHSGECHLLNNSRAHAHAISTSDLRAALRLLFLHPSSPSSHNSRISNLMTNHYCLVGRKRKRNKSSSSTNGDNSDCEEFAQEIEECARVMHLARKHTGGAMECDCDDEGDGQRMEEEVLCAVITNGVQVQLDELQKMPTGVSEVHCLVLGTAVYGPLFSWCNHSCRPNASYRFVLHTGLDSQTQQKTVYRNDIIIHPANEDSTTVSVAKKTRNARQEELWLKYQFVCHCERCDLSTASYMDRILQEINNISMIQPSCEIDSNETKAVEALLNEIKHQINEFISDSDADIFSRTLENVLKKIITSKGFVMSENQSQSGWSIFQIHPLHHLCLSAYTSLASAYRIRANDEFHCSLNNPDVASGEFDVSDLVSASTASAENDKPVTRDHDHDVQFNTPLIKMRHRINTSAQMCNFSGSTGLLDSHVARNENCYCQCSTSKENSELIKGSDLNRAAAAYTLLLAGVVHHFFLAGEQGLIMTAARFWMTAGESLLRWILGCGFQTSISEMNGHSIRDQLHLMFGSLSHCRKCDCLLPNDSSGLKQFCALSKSGYLYEKFHQEDLANGQKYPLLLRASASFFRCMNKFAKLLWPSLQSGLSLLEAIPNPVDYNWLPDSQRQFFLQDKVDEKEDGFWIDLKESDSSDNSSSDKATVSFCSYRQKEIFAIQCAVHCFCYSKYLLEICYGYDYP